MISKNLLIYCLLCFFYSYAQNDSIKTIDFIDVEKKLLEIPESHQDLSLKYDFKIVDSLQFVDNSITKDIHTTQYEKDFELGIGNGEAIFKFDCKDSIVERCYQYVGYSENAEIHIISKCHDVCELFLIDAFTGATLSVPSAYDSGAYPIFLPEYMILYSTYYDASFGDYYDYRSMIDIYEMKATTELEKKFKYIGSIYSKQWSIQALYPSNNEKSFLMKLYDMPNEFDYIEITIH